MEVENGGVERGTDSRKHSSTDEHEEAPTAKRIHSSAAAAESNGRSRRKHDDGEASSTLRETDVGICAYVDADLTPISGGIIKQRYSDFHVREVAKDERVCRITSLLPPTKEEGGSGLYEILEAQKAERDDPRGTLREERLQREAADREAKQAERTANAGPREWKWEIDEEGNQKLATLLGDDEEKINALRELWCAGPRNNKQREGKDDRGVLSRAITSKEERTAAHQLIRDLFESYLITQTVQVDTGDEKAKASALRIQWGTGRPEKQRSVRDEKSSAEQDHPPYIHFLLQKTNRDSQDALNILAQSFNLLHRGSRPGRGGGASSKSVKELSVAGTKDKRGVTVQQVAFKRSRKTLDDVWRMVNGVGRNPSARRSPLDAVVSRADRGLRVAHLRYADAPLRLGETRGNEFEIVLRNVKVQSKATVDKAFDVLKTKGFINYYGMQRFGTSAISTHEVGVALLANDYRKAIELIMAPREGDAEEAQKARELYEQGRFDDCLFSFPHFHVPERSVVQRMRGDRHLFAEGRKPSSVEGVDWKKYFSALPRTLRSMYVHAYQSYAWNTIASERVKRFGLDGPVIGDYVLLSIDDDDEMRDGAADEVDDDFAANEPVIVLSGPRKRVKLLESESDVQQYTIHDVTIPIPGTDVRFPETSWMATVYRDVLARDGLTPNDIERVGVQSSELALSGDYRKLLHLPQNVKYDLVRYADPNVNLLQSDEDRVLGIDAPPARVPFKNDDGGRQAEQFPFVALVVRFQLGISAYATMALREILKQETSSAHQRDLTKKGEDRVRIDGGTN